MFIIHASLYFCQQDLLWDNKIFSRFFEGINVHKIYFQLDKYTGFNLAKHRCILYISKINMVFWVWLGCLPMPFSAPADGLVVPSKQHVQCHHNDVIEWKHVPRYWSFVRGMYRLPVDSPHKGQWGGPLMFYLICASTNDWANNLWSETPSCSLFLIF